VTIYKLYNHLFYPSFGDVQFSLLLKNFDQIYGAHSAHTIYQKHIEHIFNKIDNKFIRDIIRDFDILY